MYNKKSVEWAHKKEINIYRHPVLSDEEKGIKKNTKLIIRRKKYSEMNEHERTVSNKRRQSYYQRKIRYLMDLAIHNKLNLFITLTFSEKITDYEDAVMCETAERCEADLIVTRNEKDYRKSKVKVLSPGELVKFLEETEEK